MGQYHTVSAPETGTGLDPFALDSGSKALEQVWSRGPGAALALLAATGTGQADRDLPWAPLGAWAGKALVMTGDYAEDGDLIGNPYLTGPEISYYGTSKEAPLTTAKRRRKNIVSLSTALIPTLERVLGRRASDHDITGPRPSKNDYTLRSLVGVTQTEQGWDIDLSACKTEQEREQTLSYYTRTCGGSLDGIKRAPVTMAGAPDSVSKTRGTPVLWVSLDRAEYIDPARMGEHDLADVVNGDSVKGVLAMIAHFEARGGGDVRELGPLALTGRWRGDRIALLGEIPTKAANNLTHAQVRDTFTDITDLVRLWMDLETITGKEFPDLIDDTQTGPSQTLNALYQEALLSEPLQTYLLGGNKVQAELFAPLLVSADKETYQIPGHFRVATTTGNQGRLWFNTTQERAFQAILASMAPGVLRLHQDSTLSCHSVLSASYAIDSAHDMIAKLSA